MNLALQIEKWLEEHPNGVTEQEINDGAYPNLDEILNDSESLFRDALVRQFVKKEDRGGRVSASGAGKCVRQLAYSYHGFEQEPLPPRTRINFILGDAIEIILVFLARMAGAKIGEQQREIDLDGLGGHLDFTLGDKVYDVKSKSSYGFKSEQDSGVDDVFGEATQGSLYCAGTGKKKFAHLNLNKNTGEIAEVEMKPDPKLVEMALWRKKQVEASTPQKLPDREHQALEEKKTGKKYLDIPCAYCAYKRHCWDIVAEENKSGTYIRYYVA